MIEPTITGELAGLDGEHSRRRDLADEIHARPYDPVRPPFCATHLARLTGEAPPDAERTHLQALATQLGLPAPQGSNSHRVVEGPDFRLRWEHHTEFSTYTIYRFGPFADPFARTALAAVPAEWLRGLSGTLMVALHLALDDVERTGETINALFADNTVIGSEVQGGVAAIWTDLRRHADGAGRILIRDRGLTPGQAGRLCQRLFEIETYRMMALLALPAARAVGPQVSAADRDLKAIIAELAGAGDDRRLLERLTRLAGEGERLSAATAYRFSAARAYHELVRRRLGELRETRLFGLQTLGEFLERRLAPAMATCDSVAGRLDDLARRIGRAGDLLRTRVDITLEEKNRELLESMNRRARLQLRLQQTVEGLSVAAISYYLVGLAGYLAKGAKGLGLALDPDLTMAVSVPLAVGLVWLGLRRLRRRLHAEDRSG